MRHPLPHLAHPPTKSMNQQETKAGGQVTFPAPPSLLVPCCKHFQPVCFEDRTSKKRFSNGDGNGKQYPNFKISRLRKSTAKKKNSLQFATRTIWGRCILQLSQRTRFPPDSKKQRKQWRLPFANWVNVSTKRPFEQSCNGWFDCLLNETLASPWIFGFYIDEPQLRSQT